MEILIAGASGLIGTELTRLALENPKVNHAHILVRRKLDLGPTEKLTQHVLPTLNETQLNALNCKPDAVFCCLGTTIKKAKSQAKFYEIDHDYVLELARFTKQQNCPQLHIVSAMGAHANSTIFYNRVKGEMERDVQELGIEKTAFYRPSLLLGNREEFRLGEQIGSVFMRIFNPLFVGKLKDYKAIPGKIVAQAMLNNALNFSGGPIYSSATLWKMAE